MLLNELSEVQQMKKDPQYVEERELLLRKLIGERVLNHNIPILSALEKDTNKNPYNLINDYLS